MEISDARTEEQPPTQTEHWVSQIAVEEWHCAGSNSPPKSIAHDEVIPFAEFGHEVLEIQQIIAVIGVAHNHIASSRRQNALPKRRPIPALAHRNDTCPLCGSQSFRTVC